MNAIRATQALNKRELENATPVTASWHTDYRDTAYIYVGGLDNRLTEGDIAVIFSQYGNPTHLQLMRDKETGKSKGFAFLKYEDQRSCDLAVDNLGGADVLGRVLRVDHTRYKLRDDEDADTWRLERLEALQAREEGGGSVDRSGDETEESDDGERRRKRRKPLLKEERELQEMLAVTQGEGEDEDPMREYLIKEKREEVERAKERAERKDKSKHRHHHHHHHRRRDEEGDDKKGSERSGDRDAYRHRDGDEDRERRKRDHDGDDERRTKR
ncbi:hypothetical protein LTR84_011990 [Exophiala bonariae]|uniref:RRM domain-containing protein n=1 Tax=Exophiala bonariae TaxID=1690606 RepID=A0AAV9MV10_9EURO|nr:hypothetical protein LTR84_011990 [Exophiala bonariae]